VVVFAGLLIFFTLELHMDSTWLEFLQESINSLLGLGFTHIAETLFGSLNQGRDVCAWQRQFYRGGAIVYCNQ
jgi:hypothetical protein